MGLNLPLQGYIDRRKQDSPFLMRIEVRDKKGKLREILYEEAGGSYSEHHPGDPSRFRYEANRGWNCAPAHYGMRGCVWMGLL